MATTNHTEQLERMWEWARELVSDGHGAPVLRCSHCGREVETSRDAHDVPESAIYGFLEHTAFGHAGRAEVLTLQVVRITSWRD